MALQDQHLEEAGGGLAHERVELGGGVELGGRAREHHPRRDRCALEARVHVVEGHVLDLVQPGMLQRRERREEVGPDGGNF